MKKFKSKKKKRKIWPYIILIIIAYFFTTKVLMNFSLKSSNEEFIKGMLNDSNHYQKYKKKDYLNLFTKYILNIDLTNPKIILESVFKYKQTGNKDEINATYIENKIEPVVYIYNTHQGEAYNDNGLLEYNITPDVQMASSLLEGLLEKDNIATIVEKGSMSEYLKNNNLDYNESYQASRYYLEQTLKDNPNLKLIIDLHRDAISKKSSTVLIDGKSYAKLMFVVGKNNDHYQSNLDLANKLNDMIKNKYPDLTRGVLTKDGTGIRGRFNQDLSEKIILIEVGGNENTIDEVMNSILVFKDIIEEYLNE